MRSLLKGYGLAALVSGVVAKTVTTELVISNEVVAPDGYSREAIVINGLTPGPVIAANKGDRLQINVKSELHVPSMNTSTTVHWHGIFQHNTNPFDGTAFVTQCPIVPGHSFLYNFSVPDQAGTFWYHSHYNLQYCDGLRGPLIIYDPEDPYSYMYDVDDISTIITLLDWYHVPAYFVAATDNPSGILVNGQGRYPGGPNTTLSVTNVEYGKRYRLRLISMSCKPHIIVSIDSHNFTIIEADGQATLPYTVDTLAVYPGQRYSVILVADQPVDNYWIRALPGSYPSNFTDGLNSAILRYSGAPDREPINRTESEGIVFNETLLHSLDNPQAPGLPYPGGADVSINIVSVMNNVTLDYFVNGVEYFPPSVPTLLQILSGTAGIQSLANDHSVYVLPPKKVIEVTFPTTFLTTPHPFHLHGQFFYVVRSAGSTEYNYLNPVQRDTVNIGSLTDNVTIRFTTDNTGPWFLHCHIDWHLQRGMAVVFAVNPNGTAQQNPVNDAWDDLCPLYNNLLASGQPT